MEHFFFIILRVMTVLIEVGKLSAHASQNVITFYIVIAHTMESKYIKRKKKIRVRTKKANFFLYIYHEVAMKSYSL